ncbi:MAG: hypothetical protein WA921_05310 [Ahrensia sp.]
MSAKPMQTLASQPDTESPLAEISRRTFWIFAILAFLSLALFVFGKTYGQRMAFAGHVDDPTPIEVVIGNDVMSIPINMVRLPDERQSGLTDTINLYVHWPTKQGFSVEHADAFNNVGAGNAEIVFLSFRVRDRFLEMNERFEPVYTKAVDGPRRTIHDGLNVQALKPALGYNDEILVWAEARNSIHPKFIARCANAELETFIAPCETDLFVGRSLEMKARFPQQMLQKWPTLNGELRAFAASLQITPNR